MRCYHIFLINHFTKTVMIIIIIFYTNINIYVYTTMNCFNSILESNISKNYSKLKNRSSSVSYQNNLWNKTFTTTLYYIYIPLKQGVNWAYISSLEDVLDVFEISYVRSTYFLYLSTILSTRVKTTTNDIMYSLFSTKYLFQDFYEILYSELCS